MSEDEIGLAFIIIGILLFLVEAAMPGVFWAMIPGTVLIALGLLMSFEIVPDTWLLPIGLVVGLGSLYGTLKFYQTFADPDTPSEMSIESYVGRTGKVTEAVSPDTASGKVRVEREEMRAVTCNSCNSDIAVGTSVEVVSAEGITLTVKPKE